MADEALFGLLRQTADPAVVEALKTSVENDQDRAAQPHQSAGLRDQAKGLDEEQTISAFLHATRIGLFELNWERRLPGM